MAVPTGPYQGQDLINFNLGNKFLPRDYYSLNSYKAPLPTSETQTVNQGFGIPYTNAFTGGGPDINTGGNAFGWGTAIDPISLGAYGEPGYSGGLSGNVQQTGWGRQEDPEGGAYLRPRKELPGIASLALGVLPFGNFLRRKIEDKMNPVYDPNATLGGYKMGGLDATGKGLYNTLAGQGMLFEGSTGLKTATGKNFMAKGYVKGQQEILDGIIGKYGSVQNAKNYFDANPKTTKFLKTQLNEALSVTGKLEEQEAYDKTVATRNRKQRIQNLKEQGEKDIHHGGDAISGDGATTITDGGSKFAGDSGAAPGTPGSWHPGVGQDRPNEGRNAPGGGTGQSPTGGDVKGTPFQKGGRIGYNRGRVVNPGGYQGDEFEDENTLEFMQDQGIPHGEMAEGPSPFEMRIEELMDTGMSWQEAYEIAAEEFGQIAEGPQDSFSEDGIASIV
jgi:hypothetical protein